MNYFRKILFLFISLNTIAALGASRFKYKVSGAIQTEVRDSQYVLKARIFSVVPEIRSRYRIMDNLSFKSQFAALLETGSNDSLYIDEYRPRRELIIREGKLEFKALSFLTLEAGAIDQAQYGSPLFLAQNAFTGVQQRLRFDFPNFKISLLFQQSIPNNQILSSRIGGLDEGTPRFFAESLFIRHQNSLVVIEGSYTLFAFESLSRSIAHQSRFLGNKVGGSGAESAEFVYTFKGHNTRLSLKTVIGFLELGLDGHYTHNNKTPTNRSDAKNIRLTIGVSGAGAFAESFDSDSDPVPAFYNTKFYGHNNMRGEVYGLYWRDRPEAIFAELQFIRADFKEASLYQNDFTGVRLNLAKSIN